MHILGETITTAAIVTWYQPKIVLGTPPVPLLHSRSESSHNVFSRMRAGRFRSSLISITTVVSSIQRGCSSLSRSGCGVEIVCNCFFPSVQQPFFLAPGPNGKTFVLTTRTTVSQEKTLEKAREDHHLTYMPYRATNFDLDQCRTKGIIPHEIQFQ